MLGARDAKYILLKRERLMMVNGKVGSEMEKEFKNGQMERFTMVTGSIIERMAKENSLILMVIYITEAG